MEKFEVVPNAELEVVLELFVDFEQFLGQVSVERVVLLLLSTASCNHHWDFSQLLFRQLKFQKLLSRIHKVQTTHYRYKYPLSSLSRKLLLNCLFFYFYVYYLNPNKPCFIYLGFHFVSSTFFKTTEVATNFTL